MARAKSKRLVDLLTLLLSARYPVSRAAIRGLEGYPRGEEAFHRQFERDKVALRELGFPVVEVGDEDRDPGYLLQRARLKLPEVRLTPEETVALALARRIGGLHALVGGNVRQALGKLGMVGATVPSSADVALVAPPARSRAEEDRLRALESAIARGHRVRLRYRALGADAVSEREVDPYGLYVHGGAWYLVGHDHLRGATRTFRTGRIEKLARVTRGTGADIVAPGGFRIEDYVERMLWGGWKGVVEDAVVRFEPSDAWRVSRLAGPRVTVKRAPDGGLLVRFLRANPDALLSWVATLGRGVTIEGPAPLRAEARKFFERVERAHRAR
ncbi:MAG: WYL domain-containing protein [Candidatus Eisenbacteria bacterium]